MTLFARFIFVRRVFPNIAKNNAGKSNPIAKVTIERTSKCEDVVAKSKPKYAKTQGFIETINAKASPNKYGLFMSWNCNGLNFLRSASIPITINNNPNPSWSPYLSDDEKSSARNNALITYTTRKLAANLIIESQGFFSPELLNL